MESFLESKPSLTGYIRQIPAERIHESWISHIDGKDPLEFIASQSLWTIEMNYLNDSPVFSLEIGFTKKGDPRWKTFKNIVVININVVQEAILIDVVNTSNNAVGVILIRVEDKMKFCSDRLLKNYKQVPLMYQSLMVATQAQCESCAGDFLKTAKAVTKYVTSASALHTAKLTVANNAQGKQKQMESTAREMKKKKTGESSSGSGSRSRPPPLSALGGSPAFPVPSSSAAPTEPNPPPSQPQAPVVAAERVAPKARDKHKTRKRKTPAPTDAGQATATQEEETDRCQRLRRTQPEAEEPQGTPSCSGQDVPDPSKVTEEEAHKLAYKKVNGRWVDNPETVPFLAETVPEKLFVELDYKKDLKRSDEANARLRLKAEAETNKKFRKLSSYMYIFGRGTYFELDVADMVNADEKTGVIFRPLEKSGVLYVLDRIVKLNFTKQILTVMPATPTRPTCWNDCTKAGPLIIINGQHTWSAAKEILSGETVVDDPAVSEMLKKWTCEVVWTDRKEHLHSLSCKCNDGNVNGPFLSSLPATLRHCRYLWDNARRPTQFRKNRKKKDQDEEYKRYEVCLVVLSSSDRAV